MQNMAIQIFNLQKFRNWSKRKERMNDKQVLKFINETNQLG